MGKVYYNQADPRWAGHPYPASPGYENATVKSAGCGPTCCAMVVSSKGSIIFPDTMCDISEQEGFRVPGGTDWGIFQYVADRWGIETREVHSSYEAFDACKEGYFVVANVGPGLWTTGGHYILLVGTRGDEIEVYDPYLYAGKFDQYGRSGKVSVEGVSCFVQIDVFKAYSECYRFFAYKINDGGENPPAPEPSDDPKFMYVNTQSKNLNVRNAPRGDVIGSLPKGTQVLVYEQRDGWCKINQNASEWVSGEYLAPVNGGGSGTVDRGTVGQVMTFKEYTHFSQYPNGAGMVYDYKAGTTVEVLENYDETQDKIRVRATGREGYVNISAYAEGSNSIGRNTVGEVKRFASKTYIYLESNLTGVKYTYLANTSVKILENVNSRVDKVYVIQTGRIGYVDIGVYA